MNASISKVNLVFFTGILIICGSLRGQICINKYSSIKYKGTTYDTITCSIVTKNNEIISAGTLYDYNGAGHIAKYSAKGTPIWSYQYSIAFSNSFPPIFFDAIHFSDIISTADGGYLISGNFDQILSYWINPHPVKKYGLIVKIDKFGKVLWNKAISKRGDQSFSNIFETSDGDFITYMANDNGKKILPGDHSYGRVLRLDSKGNIKWSSLLFTYLFDAGGLGVSNKRAIVQATNKNIIIGDGVHKTDPPNGSVIREGNLHFMELDYATGKVNWETSYEYPVPQADSFYTPDLVNVSELPGGQFSFITSLYLPAATASGFSKKGVNIITTNKGVIENIISYSPADGSACRITEVTVEKNTGNKTLLFDKHGQAMLANIKGNGQLVWQQGYDDDTGKFPGNCFSAGKNGFNIFMSNNHSFETRLLITDAVGAIDCVNVPSNIISQPAILNYSHDSVVTNINIPYDNYGEYPYLLKRNEDYPLLKNIDCQQTLACCTDIIDSNTIHKISICEGKSFVLPDSTAVKDSGNYYLTYKTALGCDSIVFYKISVDKDVSKLQVGQDTCLTPQTSIKLLATQGYDKYYWINNLTAGKADYTINHPGNFWVTVSNTCGTKTDSIIIYDRCDYPVYMPRAFTPNHDYLNDYFRIPPLNKNRLIRFRIFNRWGKLVFETTNPNSGWDGSLGNEPLPSDTFVYYLEMEGYSGNKFTQKGTFLLLR